MLYKPAGKAWDISQPLCPLWICAQVLTNIWPPISSKTIYRQRGQNTPPWNPETKHRSKDRKKAEKTAGSVVVHVGCHPNYQSLNTNTQRGDKKLTQVETPSGRNLQQRPSCSGHQHAKLETCKKASSVKGTCQDPTGTSGTGWPHPARHLLREWKVSTQL